jgi:hypothetical protein
LVFSCTSVAAILLTGVVTASAAGATDFLACGLAATSPTTFVSTASASLGPSSVAVAVVSPFVTVTVAALTDDSGGSFLPDAAGVSDESVAEGEVSAEVVEDSADDSEECSVEDSVPDGPAHAVAVPVNNAAPTPSATANPPTRPTYSAAFMGFAYADNWTGGPVSKKVEHAQITR